MQLRPSLDFQNREYISFKLAIYVGRTPLNNWSNPRRPHFLHTLSFDFTTKLRKHFLNIALFISHLNSALHNLFVELFSAIESI